jgi:uncharacterized membrane protein
MKTSARRVLPLLLPWLVVAAPAGAHKGHKPSPSGAPAVESAPPSAPAAEGAASGPSQRASVPAPAPAPPSRDAILRGALGEHMHNKIVHFPLALGCAAAVMLLLAARWPQYRPAARLLLVGAALFAAAAYFSGEAQEEAFEHGPLEEFLERHETLGKASGIVLALGAALSFWPRADRWMWIYALAVLALLSATGFFGGILSHTEL